MLMIFKHFIAHQFNILRNVTITLENKQLISQVENILSYPTRKNSHQCRTVYSLRESQLLRNYINDGDLYFIQFDKSKQNGQTFLLALLHYSLPFSPYCINVLLTSNTISFQVSFNFCQKLHFHINCYLCLLSDQITFQSERCLDFKTLRMKAAIEREIIVTTKIH